MKRYRYFLKSTRGHYEVFCYEKAPLKFITLMLYDYIGEFEVTSCNDAFVSPLTKVIPLYRWFHDDTVLLEMWHI